MALHAVKMPEPIREVIEQGDARRQAKEKELNRKHHGGIRAGAGRKPKALRYANELAEAENKIIAALPDVIDGLIRSAKSGDVAAARYLLDRVFGRVKEQGAPVADDTSVPYSEADGEVDAATHAYMSMTREMLIPKEYFGIFDEPEKPNDR